MKIYNPSTEERAFLYQEVQSLEPMIKNIGTLTVMVEENAPQNQKQNPPLFRVTIDVAPESVGMRIQATHTNLFDAVIAAREEATRKLNAVLNALPRQEGASIPRDLLH